MDAMVANGFADGEFRVPRPIDSDPESLLVIEQAMRGKSLYDKLLAASPSDGKEFLRMAARWLARLHNLRLLVTPADEFLATESERLARYLEHFTAHNNPHTEKFKEIMEAVWEEAAQIAARDHKIFMQGHGDFHPKNIFIGRDSRDDRGSAFVAAIDFESSLVMPPAFDVGYFLAQFRNQFFEHSKLVRHYPDSLFLDAYLGNAEAPGTEFLRQVELFRARTNLSIASYFINIGLGESEKMWRVLVEAEQAITTYRAGAL
jgi:aminoglycoside/choline kinase family phosphotransferase